VSRITTVVVLLALLAGCGKKASRQNDLLRAQVVDLETQVRQLSDRNRELEAALARAEMPPGEPPEGVQAATPHVVRVEIDRLSHALDEDGDGQVEALKIYVKPADGMGRFVQLAGWLSVHAADLPAGAEAETLGRITLEPIEVRQRYRTSFMGTHYSITLPLTLPADRPEGPCTVRVIYEDGRSRRRVSDEREIDLQP
jgi:outer membrane murein-binding lipoprotein Lpp